MMTTSINDADFLGRPRLSITSDEHAAHWKVPGEGKSWYEAQFRMEPSGRLNVNVIESFLNEEGRITNKRAMIELNADSARRLRDMLVKGISDD